MKKQKRTPLKTLSSTHSLEIPFQRLRWKCKPEDLGITNLEKVDPSREIIGQDRAMRALRVGLEMKQAGYNIFVTGPTGTGRTTTIKRLLREYEVQPGTLTDKCYVHNFNNHDQPKLLTLPAGEGVTFKKDMMAFVGELRKGIPAAFESRRFQERRKTLLDHFQDRQRSVLKDFERRVKDRGFEVVQVQSGPGMRPEIAPVVDGSPVSIDQLQSKVDAGELPQADLNKLLAQHNDLEGQMDLVMREMRNIERKAKASVEDLNNKIVVPLVEELIDDLEKKYASPRVHDYLMDVKKNVLEDLPRFHNKDEQPSQILGLPMTREEDTFLEYQVNVVVDNSTAKGTPVVIETNPRYKNLFGTIERVVDRGGIWRMDFTHIKAGSLLRADGGYLVLNALDALIEPGVWTTLKRTLRNRCLEIQPLESGLFGSSSALSPEPVELNVKVVMIGGANIYHLLYAGDDDFKKIFKIRADFNDEMPNEKKSIASYISFIRALCEEEKFMPFSIDGVAEVVEYGVRLSGRQAKLSTHFNVLADVIREAQYWSTKDNASRVDGKHVRKAIDEQIERVRLIEERIKEMINDGTIMIDTDGAIVGQVNGLSVYDTGEYAFGKPSRITAKTSLGKAGIINIEREADMSGPSHNKGVLILGGYLRGMYSQDKPLVVSASIAFEQSYSGVDGDSASSTEVYALLSSIAGVPLRQDLAVTGSVNQHGEIQPIGGVNLKIEGFFDVCKSRGLTGKQGVLIPHQNAKDLMLRHDVVEAARKKEFHIYSIRTIDQGIALLTGKPAGKRLSTGKYTPGSIHALVDARLSENARLQKRLGVG